VIPQTLTMKTSMSEPRSSEKSVLDLLGGAWPCWVAPWLASEILEWRLAMGVRLKTRRIVWYKSEDQTMLRLRNKNSYLALKARAPGSSRVG
jgi:hypothetical protein